MFTMSATIPLPVAAFTVLASIILGCLIGFILYEKKLFHRLQNEQGIYDLGYSPTEVYHATLVVVSLIDGARRSSVVKACQEQPGLKRMSEVEQKDFSRYVLILERENQAIRNHLGCIYKHMGENVLQRKALGPAAQKGDLNGSHILAMWFERDKKMGDLAAENEKEIVVLAKQAKEEAEKLGLTGGKNV